MRRSMTTMGSLVMFLFLGSTDGGAQIVEGGATNCADCEQDMDPWGFYHRFSIFAEIAANPSTGHGPHSTWKDGLCFDAHNRCYLEEENVEELVARVEAEDWTWVAENIARLGERAVIDKNAHILQLFTCSGRTVRIPLASGIDIVESLLPASSD